MPNPVKLIENDIFVQGRYPIGATFFKPDSEIKQKLPAVLFIAGSGKVDRDVNVPKLKTNIFKLLAIFFANIGLPSVRYDKRGCGESGGSYIEAGISDYTEDALSVLKWLKAQPWVDPDKIILLGHSEGAFIAPAIASKEEVNALILLCGGIKPGSALLPEQPASLAQEIREVRGIKGCLLRLFRIDKFILWQFNRVLSQALQTTQASIKLFGLIPFNAKWLREFYHFNVEKYLNKLDIPIIVIGGEKDIQSDPNAANSIAKSCKNAEAHIINGMNHLLRYYDGNHSFLSCLAEYKKSVSQPLNSELLDILEHWINRKNVRCSMDSVSMLKTHSAL